MTLRTRIFVAVSLACLLATVGFATPRAAAENLNWTFYGSRTAGWGFTNTSLSIPGPPITVEVGDNVTLNLTSVDPPRTHRWFIDYNNNSAADGSEPRSPNFGTTAVVWNFTVSNVTGTFRYMSDRGGGGGNDAATMWGNITIQNATASGGGLDSSGLIIVGLVVLAIAVVAVAVLFGRRSKGRQVPPPPPEE